LSKITSIATALPPYRHQQQDIMHFMQNVYALNEVEKRKLKYLYAHSGIETRYSVIEDYGLSAADWSFYPASENLQPFPSLEKRMEWYNKTACPLSVQSIEKCVSNKIDKSEITHLITVSCTGMSAPGLDLQIVEAMNLAVNIFRTSLNFMGCYGAVHALKLADAICNSDTAAKVVVVCTELCTLHFQNESKADNIASSLLFSDGSAAMLITSNQNVLPGITIQNFYSEISYRGKADMSWELSSKGFLMTLSGYVPELIEEDFEQLFQNALQHGNIKKDEITHWCVHPGGKRILSAIQKSIDILPEALQPSYDVLRDYGNMSSPTILFVLEKIAKQLQETPTESAKIFGAAFGPGLTMETFILSNEPSA
jgi:predicted naringenin-chalcone synthase